VKNSEEITDYISKKTKRGMLLLVFICLCIVYAPRVLSLFKEEDAVQLTQQEIQKMEELKRDYQKNNPKKEIPSKNECIVDHLPSLTPMTTLYLIGCMLV